MSKKETKKQIFTREDVETALAVIEDAIARTERKRDGVIGSNPAEWDWARYNEFAGMVHGLAFAKGVLLGTLHEDTEAC